MKLLKLLVTTLIPLSAFADPQFTNISDDDMKVITKAMGSNFTHNSMLGASKLGTIFGFQVGVVAAQTDVPDLNDLVKENSGSDLKNLYNAGLMGAVGIPFGFSFEAVVIPTMEADDSKVKANSFAVKFNINDVIPILPVNLALRGVLSNAEFSFNQTISGASAKVKNTTDVSGVQLLFSPMFPIVEPYIGVGMLTAKNKLEVTGTSGTIFSGTTLQEKSETVNGTQVLAGIDVNLLLLKIGVEYSKAFDNTKYGVKLAFGF